MHGVTQQSHETLRKLRTYVGRELLQGQDQGLDEATPLLELGVIDSLKMVSLLSFIEDEFGVHISDDDVSPDRFENLETITELVEASRERQGTASVRPSTPAPGESREIKDLFKVIDGFAIDRRRIPLADGGQLHFLQTKGSDSTWILLPALGNPSSLWSGVLRSIEDEQSALAPDLPGFGVSTSSKQGPGFADQLEALLTLIDGVAKPPVVLFGCSVTSALATEIARRRPERVRALVLSGFGAIDDAAVWWQRLQDASSPATLLEQTYYQPPPLTAHLQRALEDVLARPAYTSFFDDAGRTAVENAFEGVRCPTLLVHGDDDRLIGLAQVEAASSRLPHARIERLARCGHLPPMERPEELLAVVRAFLRGM